LDTGDRGTKNERKKEERPTGDQLRAPGLNKAMQCVLSQTSQ